MYPAPYLTPYKTNANGINYYQHDWVNYTWDLGTFKELNFKWIKFRQFYEFCLISRKLIPVKMFRKLSICEIREI